MKHDSPLWKVMGDPATPAEAAALDAFRELLPDDGITTAWANLTFINDQGRTAEVDVLLLTPQGMYLVELKGWHATAYGPTLVRKFRPSRLRNCRSRTRHYPKPETVSQVRFTQSALDSNRVILGAYAAAAVTD
ncbi:NERD domain-containing protein [Mycolicibacterium goodii]|uniref:nuclease-related domain-containing protein n=1 Tax=Mycolicibacterium goodii TaxID=134601 RepID=UPI001BDD8659|nr:nuclease-related domain-containing protein [Mycolicibacterium goodii]MBU8820263.1 NERD domain-containing protein [Mycolicibacterium goodii]